MPNEMITKTPGRKLYVLNDSKSSIDMIVTDLTGGSFPGLRDVSVHFVPGNLRNIDGREGNVFRTVMYRREKVLPGGYYDGTLSHPGFLEPTRLTHRRSGDSDSIFFGDREYAMYTGEDRDSLIADIVTTPVLTIEMVLEREDSPGTYWVVVYDAFERKQFCYYEGRRVKNPHRPARDEANLPTRKFKYVDWDQAVSEGGPTMLLPHARIEDEVLMIRQASDYEIAEVAGNFSTLAIRTPEVRKEAPRPGRLLA